MSIPIMILIVAIMIMILVMTMIIIRDKSHIPDLVLASDEDLIYSCKLGKN